MTRYVFLSGLAAALAALGCNEVPVGNLTSSYVVQVEELREHATPAKLDILWVVDDSPSMCQEQQSLARNFRTFLNVFKQFAGIDMRLAVTTTNVCPKDKAGAVRGKFVYHPATEFPPGCVQNRVVPCLDDSQCQNNPSLPDSKNWVCEPKPAQYMYTCDKPTTGEYGTDPFPGEILHSVNSICRYKCDRENAPAECARVFGEPEGCVATCGTSCSVSTCQSETSLSVPDGCGLMCAVGADCDSKCNEVLKDAAKCAEICGLEPKACFDKCSEVSKGPSCENVCASDWDCMKKCESYLFDSVKCANVCTGGSCFDTCSNTEFKKQDFLCSLVCDGSYDCDDKCLAEFGDSTYRCLYPGGDQSRAGCLLPPSTRYCPANGPKMLDREVAERYFDDWKALKWAGNPAWQGLDDDTVRDLIFEQLFICMASVDVSQSLCGSQEQGLLAAWMALDKNGENAAQAASFLRDDAFLLIIFVSDEDDCSSEYRIPSIEAGKCACKADTNGCTPDGKCESNEKCFDGNGNLKCVDGLNNPINCNSDKAIVACPLYPTSTFINRLKSLKPDPAQVVVATIVGDVIPGSTTSPSMDADAIRERYYECKCDKIKYAGSQQYATLTYGCLSAQGKADIGNRYMQVAAGFGPRYGQTSNICDDQGLEGSLEKIANLVIPLLTAICLPRPMDEDEYLEVTVVNQFDETFPQQEITPTNPDGDFELIKNFPACPKFSAADGHSTFNAVRFAQPLEYLDRVQMTYKATPFYVKP
ncbi:MAG: hypothetical protein GXP54_04810 [Deltaproteobacteria bacterium]|nr:hypothetical protein [Deltaproteobacteria bacterium]